MYRFRVVLISAAVAAVAACGGASGGAGYVTSPGTNNPGGTTSNTNQVMLVDQTFTPGTVEVPAGTTVTWQWSSCSGGGYGGYSCLQHTVTFDDGSNIASVVQDSGTFKRTFAAPGTYKYHCAIHGAAMSGVVVVK